MPKISSNYYRINLRSSSQFLPTNDRANVLARFGLKHPSRCLGLVLINCTGSAATVLETFKTKFITWKADEVGQGAEDFLLYHKFGHVSRSVQFLPEHFFSKVQLRLNTSLTLSMWMSRRRKSLLVWRHFLRRVIWDDDARIKKLGRNQFA